MQTIRGRFAAAIECCYLPIRDRLSLGREWDKPDESAELDRALRRLHTRRQKHVNAIARVDAVFERYGLAPDVTRSRKSSKRSTKGRTRKIAMKKAA